MAFSKEGTARRYLWRPKVLIPFVVIVTIWGAWLSRVHERIPTLSKSNFGFSTASKATHGAADTSFSDIQNSTLGFENLFILNLPSRPDKRDAFTLTASLTGFQVDIIEGVIGSTVPDKALTFDASKMGDARDRNIGSWRAHTNFLRKVVEDRLSSAMLFEDDTDWDVSLKTQVSQIAQGTRFLSSSSSPSTTPPHSPYGDNWDLFWPGHCGTGFDPHSARFIIDNDPSVPAPKRRINWGPKPNMSAYDPHARVVHRMTDGCCTYAYAVSLRGAQKLLHRQATRTEWVPYDVDVARMCMHDPHFRCLSVFPQIINSHGAAGAINRDSDLSDIKETSVREKGFTHNVVTSARLNVKNLLGGREPERQYPVEDGAGEVEGPVTFRVEEVRGSEEEISDIDINT